MRWWPLPLGAAVGNEGCWWGGYTYEACCEQKQDWCWDEARRGERRWATVTFAEPFLRQLVCRD